MSDRIKGFVVALENNIRDDDAESIANAIRLLHGVVSVTPSVDKSEDHMNREKVRSEMTFRILEALKK